MFLATVIQLRTYVSFRTSKIPTQKHKRQDGHVESICHAFAPPQGCTIQICWALSGQCGEGYLIFLFLLWLNCCIQKSSFYIHNKLQHAWETNSKKSFLNLQQLSNSLLLMFLLNHSKLSRHKQNFLFLISQYIWTLKLV